MGVALDRRRGRLTPLVAAVCVALATWLAPPASAQEFGVAAFDVQILDSSGNPETRAGAAPDRVVTRLVTNTTTHPDFPAQVPMDDLRDALVDLPVGFAGDPQAVPTCSAKDFALGESCPDATRVGTARVVGTTNDWTAPIYNVDAGEHAARFAFRMVTQAATFIVSDVVQTGGEHHVRTSVHSISAVPLIYDTTIELWGVPADHNGSGSPRTALLRNPTSCEREMAPVGTFRSWQEPDVWHDAVSASASPVTDCHLLEFDPSIDIAVDSGRANAPAGVDVKVEVPQHGGADALAASHLENAVVTLPEGMTLSPAVATGLGGCSDGQLGVDREPVGCPAASKIGSVTMVSPALADPVPGEIYVGTPTAAQPYRIFVVLRGPGFTIRLHGAVDADPASGRLTTSFLDNPQLPFSEMTLRFKGGPRAPLVTPATCGVKTVHGNLSPWSDPASAVSVSDSFVIDEGCRPFGFAPEFTGGTIVPAAGSFSPLVTRFARSDGDAMFGRIDATLPPGLLARLRGVELCTAGQVAQAAGRSGLAAISSPACPVGSQIGTATVGAGAGSSPFYPRLPGGDVSGRVFLTEAYAPATGPAGDQPAYGLAVEVPAVAGPYDLGNVLVRAGIYVDPDTAQLRVFSDPLPTILGGIPLQVRDVRLSIDRDGFTVNPTSCSEMEVQGVMHSTDGRTARGASRFQVGGCAAKAFSPRLGLRLVGRAQRRPGRHPGLRAVLRQPGGQANVRAVRVSLPPSLALDPANANDVCGYEAGVAGDCPAASRIGRAVAHSPLLNRTLSGPVNLVQGIRIDPDTGNRIRTLPTLLVNLRGEVNIDLRARTSVAGKRLVTTFPTVPDAAVSRFALRLRTGKGGILAVTGERNLCATTRNAGVRMAGHNGKRVAFKRGVKAPCGKRRR